MQPILVRPRRRRRRRPLRDHRRRTPRARRPAGRPRRSAGAGKDVPDEAAAVMSLIENIQREDLNPLEEAQGLQRLIDEFGLTHDRRRRPSAARAAPRATCCACCNLSEPVQQMLMAGDIDMGHARALLPLDGASRSWRQRDRRARSCRCARPRGWSRARAAGSAGRRRCCARKARSRATSARSKNNWPTRLTAPVEIRVQDSARASGEQGEIAIAFGSLDELNGLLDKLGLTSATLTPACGWIAHATNDTELCTAACTPPACVCVNRWSHLRHVACKSLLVPALRLTGDAASSNGMHRSPAVFELSPWLSTHDRSLTHDDTAADSTESSDGARLQPGLHQNFPDGGGPSSRRRIFRSRRSAWT